MVYINQVELTNFKSFGGTMKIPLEEGFTVVTGPNGSGKSNILDGVLFCLGLATSRGMRADRLPDLVNSAVLKAGKAAETIVSVRFDLSDWSPDIAEAGLEKPEEGPWIMPNQENWTVTRKLRVMPGGSYSSSYLSDGEPCNLQQLQTQLRRLRVDPEGSNVVMQGDVTRVVSMSNKDRRSLIDELAGVALFDSRIEQTRNKLNDVHDRQERCRIVEQELNVSRQKLQKDCEKAKIYKQLKEDFQLGKKQEIVLNYENIQNNISRLNIHQKKLEIKDVEESKTIQDLEEKLSEDLNKLDNLQILVKELGEDKLLAIQATIAGLESQIRELDRQANSHKIEGEKLKDKKNSLFEKRKQIESERKVLLSKNQDTNLKDIEEDHHNLESAVEIARRRIAEVAGKSGEWVEGQKERTIRRQKLQNSLKPLKEEHQILEENLLQIEVRIDELESNQKKDVIENQKVHSLLKDLDNSFDNISSNVVVNQKSVKRLSENLSIQQRTRQRVEQEQIKIERQIARAESRKETIQESRGAAALNLLLESGLDGIHGLVAQLGEVKDTYRLALEVAAGGRLGQVVVDNDQIASQAIELLKRKKAGRLTFLPLNKIKSSKNLSNPALQRNIATNGLVGKAFDLVKFEPIYSNVFAYIFGETLVFENLSSARSQLGISRAVTLEGELIEKSGAMTGGSFLNKSLGLSFGSSSENDDLNPLRQRLSELGVILQKSIKEESDLKISLADSRQTLVDLEQRKVAIETERSSANRSHEPLINEQNERLNRLEVLKKEIENINSKIHSLNNMINPITIEIEKLEGFDLKQGSEMDMENWKKLQIDLDEAEKALDESRLLKEQLLNKRRNCEFSLGRLDDQMDILSEEENNLKSAVNSLTKAHQEWRGQHQKLVDRRQKLEIEQKSLETKFGEQRRLRDRAEAEVSHKRQSIQEAKWNLEKLRDEKTALLEELRVGQIRLLEIKQKLPEPLPEIPESIRNDGLDALQSHLEKLQGKMESLEPVNMLALEELGKLEERLESLIQRLDVLSEERSELLLRIETVATLRQEAFMEAFEAVNTYFKEIFASLSEGDGHLQLENPDDPLEGGLTLVAHPKGKSVRRLAAMSGGEKSLTALSFLFALQRFRPSPFYALDEVDSFLDGVNVDRLSSLIAKQSIEAQFLVVSHRRPMIGASSRTIGVTQARGAHTQVVGLPIAA